MSARESVLQLERRIQAEVLGQQTVIRHVTLCLLAGGHVLLEGLPGLAKTRVVRALANHLDATMNRIQFTPDLLPSDITGAEVLQEIDGVQRVHFQPGPLFGDVILADEINRAPAKVQSALLEAMEERQITVAGQRHHMPPLFMVLATQNPLEQEGTYSLPEAQLDRFLVKALVDYPRPDDEMHMLRMLRVEGSQSSACGLQPAAPLAQETIHQARREVAQVHVSPAIDRYIIELVNATRTPLRHDEDLAQWIATGVSPRAAIALDRLARGHAWLEGRDYVCPEDITQVVHPAMRHRLHLSYEAVAQGITVQRVIDRLLDCIALPA